MTEPTKGRGGRPVFLIVGGVALTAVLAFGAWFYFCVLMGAPNKQAPDSAQLWGVRGDAMGPFAAILNAGALVAALWAVHLQRKQMRESQEDTQRQLSLFNRTAKANLLAAKATARLGLTLAMAKEREMHKGEDDLKPEYVSYIGESLNKHLEELLKLNEAADKILCEEEDA